MDLQFLKDLNKSFFILYGELYENCELLGSKQFNFMSEKLFEQYKIEYTLLALQKDLADKPELFKIKTRLKFFVPFSFLFLRNKIAKQIKKEVSLSFKEYFSQITKPVNKDFEK